MADTKISAAADITTLVGTDMLPVARSASTTAYHATMTEVGAFANANLVTASTTTLGGVKVDGTTITIAGGVISGAGGPTPSSSVPNMDGVGAAGTAPAYSRGDHVHPTNTLLAPLASPALTGSPTAPTVTPATDNTTKLATTAFVQSAMSAAGVGVSSWNTRTGAVSLLLSDVTGVGGAPLASPAFTGTPTLPTGTTAVTQAVGNSTTAVASTAFVQTAVAPTYDNVGRNLIHNPLMNVWQRGTGTFNVNGGYSADRWVVGFTGTAAATAQVAITDAYRASIGDEAAIYGLRTTYTGSAAAGDYTIQMHRLENVRRLGGKTITVSFWAMAEVAGQRIGVSLDQVFGSGGSPSATVSINGQSVALGAPLSWARYSLTFTLPSTSGVTLGTNVGTDYTQLDFWYTAGSTYAARSGNVGVQSGTTSLWGIQLEVGSVATPLEKLEYADDLRHCQRFYQTGNVQMGGYTLAGSGIAYRSSFSVTMRANPTITPNFTTNINISTPGMSAAADGYQLNGVGTATATFNLAGTFTASADL